MQSKKTVGKLSIAVCVLGLGLLAGAPANSEVVKGDVKEVTTIGGVLKAEDNLGEAALVTLGTKRVALDDYVNFVSILGKYRIKDKDVVLVSEQCSGSACTFVSIQAILIAANGTATVAKYAAANKDDYGVSVAELSIQPLDVVQQGDSLRITGKQVDGRRVRTVVWVYQDGVIKRAK